MKFNKELQREILSSRTNDNLPCFLLRTKSGYITPNGRVTRDLNLDAPARFESREAAQKYRAAYVSKKWNVAVEEL